jgi:ABC-2 type transport system ATP-binding protein
MSQPRAARDESVGGARIEAQAVTRRFGEHVALDRVDLSIEPGESFGLLGANGAGKTTFIRLITGFMIPSAGEIRVDGLSPVKHPRKIQNQLGYVSETSHLYPELRVGGYLRFAGGIRGLTGGTLDAAIDQVVARFQLTEVVGRLIGNLSKGYQQRVSLAQAFLHQPRLLIVDEPTSGLDPVQQAEVRECLAEVAGRCTLLLCTHELEEARTLTTRVAILSRGRIVREGPTEKVLGDADVLELFRDDSSASGSTA